MDVHVSLVGRKDLAGEIYRQLRSAILDSRLSGGERLRVASWRGSYPSRARR